MSKSAIVLNLFNRLLFKNYGWQMKNDIDLVGVKS
jgi:hypothetical protein|tara:strand:- start:1203 stop:1307 length:105 start_codon:yes stop_codon:yes gene_type:complete